MSEPTPPYSKRSDAESAFGMSTVEEIDQLADWHETETHVHLLVHLVGDQGSTEIAIPRALLVDLEEPMRGSGT